MIHFYKKSGLVLRTRKKLVPRTTEVVEAISQMISDPKPYRDCCS